MILAPSVTSGIGNGDLQNDHYLIYQFPPDKKTEVCLDGLGLPDGALGRVRDEMWYGRVLDEPSYGVFDFVGQIIIVRHVSFWHFKEGKMNHESSENPCCWCRCP
jgi:hypothetical protein